MAPYFASKLAAESPVGALFPLLFAALVYPAAGLHPRLSRCDIISILYSALRDGTLYRGPLQGSISTDHCQSCQGIAE